ncbi:GPI-anchored protein PB15E9.01c, partial [Biomphalaria glabrata]
MLGQVLNVFFASITGLSGVFGATCVTKPTCERTDYTLPLCVSGTCACLNSSFVPIRSGCA